MRNVRASTVALLMFVLTTNAHADHGQHGIQFSCDRRGADIGVKIFILWNEDLDAFMDANPKGIQDTSTAHIALIEESGRHRRRCTSATRRVQFDLNYDTRRLSISEGSKTILTKTIKFTEQPYELRSSGPHTWLECWGRGESLRCGPLTESESTAPEELERSWGRTGANISELTTLTPDIYSREQKCTHSALAQFRGQYGDAQRVTESGKETSTVRATSAKNTGSALLRG